MQAVNDNQPALLLSPLWTSSPVVQFMFLKAYNASARKFKWLTFNATGYFANENTTFLFTWARRHRRPVDSADPQVILFGGEDCHYADHGDARIWLFYDGLRFQHWWSPSTWVDAPIPLYSGRPVGQVLSIRFSSFWGMDAWVDGVAGGHNAGATRPIWRWVNPALGKTCVPGEGEGYFTGEIQEAVMYDRVLTTTMQSTVTTCMTPPPPEPVSCSNLRAAALWSLKLRNPDYQGPIVTVRASHRLACPAAACLTFLMGRL